jgi:hypothetical protein
MTAIVLGVMAVAVLNALAFPDFGVGLPGQNSPTSAQPAATAEPKLTSSLERPQGPTASISPIELARSINHARRAQTNVELAETWQKLGVDAGSFEVCGSDCEAKVFRYELSSHTGTEVVLKLTQSFDLCRFLIFGQAKDGGWKFLGHVDHDFNKYEMARQRIASVNGKPFLIIRGQEGSGSGFALYAETWYEVSDTGVKPVLNYPADGHTNPWPAGLARSFQATNIPTTDRERLTIQYTVTYDAGGYDGDGVKLEFINRHRLSYHWDNSAGEFALDPQQSNISAAEVAAIANTQSDDEPKAGTKIGETVFYSASESRSFIGGGYEVFLKYNFPRLLTIAKGRAGKSKTWLKQFLTECNDTDEKKTLLAALEK